MGRIRWMNGCGLLQTEGDSSNESYLWVMVNAQLGFQLIYFKEL